MFFISFEIRSARTHADLHGRFVVKASLDVFGCGPTIRMNRMMVADNPMLKDGGIAPLERKLNALRQGGSRGGSRDLVNALAYSREGTRKSVHPFYQQLATFHKNLFSSVVFLFTDFSDFAFLFSHHFNKMWLLIDS